jgi:hypothetical protein
VPLLLLLFRSSGRNSRIFGIFVQKAHIDRTTRMGMVLIIDSGIPLQNGAAMGRYRKVPDLTMHGGYMVRGILGRILQ